MDTINQEHPQHATHGDISRLLPLLDKANAYSLTVWSSPTWRYPDIARDSFVKEINLGNCYFFETDDKVPYIAICLSNHDKTLWLDDARVKALYLHKFMKDPKLAPANAGKKLLQFATRFATLNNYQYIRGDATDDQIRLINYYQRLGFQIKGRAKYSHIDHYAVLLQTTPKSLQEHLNEA